MEKCKDCDYENLRSTLHEGGELNVSNEQVDGKDVRTRACKDCGYKEVRGYIEAHDCTGEAVGQIELSLYNDEELLYSGKNEGESSHSWQTTSVKYGDDCKDGVVIIKACKTCGQKEYETTFDHIAIEEKIDIDYAGSCGGTMTLKKCSACDQVLGLLENPSSCHFMLTDDKFVNGGREIAYKCVDCGLILVNATSNAEISICKVLTCETTKLSYNGEVVFTLENQYTNKNHYESSYTYTYELLGDSCLDGIITTGVCKNCGHTERTVETYVERHREKDAENIQIDTPCGAILVSYPCVCGVVNEIHTYDGCNLLTTGEGSKEIDGVKFSVTTKTCTDCDTVRVHTYATVDDGCNLHYYEQIEYKLHESTIYDTGMCDTYIVPRHPKEKKSMALGPSCEIDGMLMVEMCENCDYYSYHAYDYHYKTEVERIDVIEYGVCGGYIGIERCPCDKGEERGFYGGYTCNLEESYGEDENGKFSNLVCSDCGFTMASETKFIYENCQKIIDTTVSFSIGENVLYEFKPTYEPEEAHQLESTFRLLADKCYQGLYEISKCKDCDYEKATTHYSCVIKESLEFGFRDYGVCDGAYYYRTCYCGDMFREYYSLYCNMVEVGSNIETIDGVTYTTTTNTCKTCGVVETVVNYLGLEGCYEYSYNIYSATIGEKVLAEDVMMKSYVQSYHKMERTIKLLGESCLDGFYDIESCTKCDDEISLYYDQHNVYQKYYYYGGDNCVHTVLYYECPCAEVHELRISSVDEVEDGYACDKCGFKVVETSVTKKENCKETVEVTRKAYIGDELQLECVDTYLYDSHAFSEPVLSSQDGKETITSTCKDCGFELVQEMYILIYEDGDWGTNGEASFTVSEDGKYMVYISSFDAYENYVLDSKNNILAVPFSVDENYPACTVELQKDASYKLTSTDYNYSLTLSAFAVIKGEYNMCVEAEDTIKLLTSDGKYELTLCASCHIILDVQEISQ